MIDASVAERGWGDAEDAKATEPEDANAIQKHAHASMSGVHVTQVC